MQVVGIVSAGAMGSAVGAAYRVAGSRVVATVTGRSARTAALAERAGLELVPDLDAVVAAADLVLSIVPPDQAGSTAAAVADAAGRTGARPLVADWNAVSPATVRAIGESLEAAGSSSSTGRSRAARRARAPGLVSTSRAAAPRSWPPGRPRDSTSGSWDRRSVSPPP